MRFVRQSQTIRVTNFNDRLMTERYAWKHVTDFCSRYHLWSVKLQQNKHVDKLAGKFAYGVCFENVYLKSLQQPKYRYLENLLAPIEEIGYFTPITVTLFRGVRRFQIPSLSLMM